MAGQPSLEAAQLFTYGHGRALLAGAHAVLVTEVGLGPFGDERPFGLGYSTEHLEGEHALRGSGVDRIMQAAEMSAARLELLDDREQVIDGTGKAIEPDRDQALARPDLA
jgi:hypothetical protein